VLLALGAVPALVTRLRRRPPDEALAQALLVLLAVAATLLGSVWSRWVFPPVFLAVPLVVGGMLLSVPGMRRVTVAAALCLGYDALRFGLGTIRLGALLVLVVTSLIAFEFARSRQETGLVGLSGDAVLVELRDRLEQQGEPPELGGPWHVEAFVKAAGDVPFSGDFVVSALLDDGCFEVALVDVSGKGVEAGTRSLLLSGAMGGLLGATAPEEFLAAANTYLVRQSWDEGFATAVHLTLRLDSGQFNLASAGHPPVAHFDAGSGRWGLIEAEGVALGLLPDAQYAGVDGVLRPGDALLLYTDGLVEVPGRDLELGIDKLLGEAERVMTQGFEGGGRLLVSRVAEHSTDDRGVVLLWRSRKQ
jgi:hypothetical protein